MSTLLSMAILLITLALVLYSVGVWSERLARRLKPWHLVFFWLGLAADTAGTTLMTRLPGTSPGDVHSLTGVAAILLMLLHATWATAVVARRDEKSMATFHRFSLAVWLVWLVPFGNGLLISR